MIRAMMVCSGKRRQPGMGGVHDEVLVVCKQERTYVLITTHHLSPDIYHRPRRPSNIEGSLITCDVILPNQENKRIECVPRMFRESDGCSIVTCMVCWNYTNCIGAR
jgi:hypothetical protein